jgi:hypothetical protein
MKPIEAFSAPVSAEENESRLRLGLAIHRNDRRRDESLLRRQSQHKILNFGQPSTPKVHKIKLLAEPNSVR